MAHVGNSALAAEVRSHLSVPRPAFSLRAGEVMDAGRTSPVAIFLVCLTFGCLVWVLAGIGLWTLLARH